MGSNSRAKSSASPSPSRRLRAAWPEGRQGQGKAGSRTAHLRAAAGPLAFCAPPAQAGGHERQPHSQRRPGRLLERRRRQDLGGSCRTSSTASLSRWARSPWRPCRPPPATASWISAAGPARRPWRSPHAWDHRARCSASTFPSPCWRSPDGARRPARLPQAQFLAADAQTYSFEPRRSGWRVLALRGDVLRRPAGRLRQYPQEPQGRRPPCLRLLAAPRRENPWMRPSTGAVFADLPPGAAARAGAPGPFGFADPERVRAILAAAGFADIQIAAHDRNSVATAWTPPSSWPCGSVRSAPCCASTPAGARRWWPNCKRPWRPESATAGSGRTAPRGSSPRTIPSLAPSGATGRIRRHRRCVSFGVGASAAACEVTSMTIDLGALPGSQVE